MSDVRPSGNERDGAAELLASARARVSAAAADLALPQGMRLSEWQRITLRGLLAQLVRSVEDALRAEIAQAPVSEALRAALSSAHVEIAMPVLAGTGALAEPALIDLLLRRAEEHRLHRADGSDNALLVELAGDGDEAVAGAAMALLIAQNGRVDGFREPVLPRSDLPAEIEHYLVWSVAAALRRYMIVQHLADPSACDAALGAAAARLLAGHDEGESAEARAMRLALAVQASGRGGDDALLVRALSEGSLAFFLALIGLRTGLEPGAGWELLTARSGPVLLLRAADVARAPTAAILLRLGTDENELGAALDRFDGMTSSAAPALLGLWTADPGYRDAVARLAQ
ncbi:MAG TPA: DUF2336 domain-containing protein [Allosphingosinicella sp.]|jgi:hypothetical protein